MKNNLSVALVMLVFAQICTLTAGGALSKQSTTQALIEKWIQAVRRGDLAILTKMIENGMPVDTKGSLGMTPLSCAVVLHKPEIVRFLLERGASPTEPVPAHDSVITCAVSQIATDNRSPEILHELLRHYPARHTLRATKWMQLLTELNDPQVAILEKALDAVEGGATRTVAQKVLKTILPPASEINGTILSYVSAHEETPAEQARTLQLFAEWNQKKR